MALLRGCTIPPVSETKNSTCKHVLESKAKKSALLAFLFVSVVSVVSVVLLLLYRGNLQTAHWNAELGVWCLGRAHARTQHARPRCVARACAPGEGRRGKRKRDRSAASG